MYVFVKRVSWLAESTSMVKMLMDGLTNPSVVHCGFGGRS